MAQQRGRTPSAGHINQLRQPLSPSPHAGFINETDTLGVDPQLLGQPNLYMESSGTLFPDQSMLFPLNLDPQLSMDHLQFQNSSNQVFGQAQNYAQQNMFAQSTAQQMNGLSSTSNMTGAAFNDFSNYNDLEGSFLDLPMGNMGDNSQNVDPSIFLETALPPTQFNEMNLINNAAFFPSMTSLPQQRLSVSQNTYNPAQAHANAFTLQNDYARQLHSHKDSLDPSSAAFPSFGPSAEWTSPLYQGHRRAPSDARSDISSAHASPFLGHADSFESIGQHSPMLNGLLDTGLVNDASLNFNRFSLTEQPSNNRTPADSPIISPVGMAQMPATYFGLGLGMSSMGMNLNGTSGFVQQSHLDHESFPTLHVSGQGDTGYAEGTLSPPEINIEYAPPARTPTLNEPNLNGFEHTLSPPNRSHNRLRNRANSAPYAVPKRESSPMRGRSPSVGTSLSPHTPLQHSRSSSPGSNSGVASLKRRTSTSSIPDRDRLLDLARNQAVTPPLTAVIEPSVSPAASNEGGKRAQKHPANFACTLCDKRFTRAYNLRSHLRTHTDERPFVCTVCGKAFARQHDRKRHEGLHTGERKFVCYGLLKENAGTWGCKRRFARADALGRHFRSEAGRACIGPLLDEEAHERQTALIEEANQNMMNGGNLGTGPGATAAPMGEVLDVSRMPLPAALLQMYPALADIQWNAQPMHQGGMDGGEYDGFDASSGGEGWDDEEGYLSGTGMGGNGTEWSGGAGASASANMANNAWTSDYGVR